MDVLYEIRDSYLYAKLSGEMNVTHVKQDITAIVDKCLANNIHKVLVDASRVYGSYSIFDRYKVGKFLASENIRYLSDRPSDLLKIAVVLDESLLDPARFGDKVARNRGVDLMSTDRMEDAYRWLGIENPAGARP